MNNKNLDRKFNSNTESTVFSTQYISTKNFDDKNHNDKSLSLLDINIISLSKNKSLLEELMSSYNMFQDIIGLCETKLNKISNIDLIPMKNTVYILLTLKPDLVACLFTSKTPF